MSYDAGSIDATMRLDRTPFQQGLEEARSEVRQFEAERHAAKLTIDSANATATIEALRENLRRIGADSPEVRIQVDQSSAQAQIDRLREQLGSLSRTTATPRINMLDADARSRLLSTRAQLEDFSRQVATARLSANDTQARAALAGIDAQLHALQDRVTRPGVTIQGTREAEAQLLGLQARLDRINGQNATATAEVDTSNGSANLGALSGALSRLAGIGKITVVVEAVVAGAGALAVLLGQLGALGGAAAAGGAATGLVGLAGRSILSPVLNNFKQIGQASGGTGGGAGSSQANAVISAQEAVGVAQQKSADDQVDSARKISDAQRSLGDAYRQAAQSAQQAADTVHSAEETLTTAQQAETTAQQALSQARRDAARQLEDYNLQLEQSTTNQAQATFAVTDAQKALTTLVNQRQQGDTRITAEDISKAQLAVDAAKENLQGLQTAGSRLQADAAVAAQKGVEGSTAVVAAKQAESAAVQAVTDDQHKLTEAIQAQGQAQKDSAEKIATAQEAVATAQLDASRQARDDARSVADAQRALAQAMRAQGAAAGGAASGLKKLDAAQQGLLNSMLALKAQATSLFKTVEPQIIGSAHNIVNGLSDALRTFTPALAPAANALEQVSQGFQRAMSGPAAQRFSAFMTTQGPNAIRTFATSAGNLGSGVLNIFEAFTPLIGTVEHALLGVTNRIKDFTATLPSNPAFQQFLQFVKDNAPLVGKVVHDIFNLLLLAFQALEPVIPPVLKFIDTLANSLKPILPVLGKLIGDLATALTPLLPHLGTFVTNIGRLLDKIVSSPGFAHLIDAIGGALDKIGTALASIPQSTITTVFDALAKLVTLAADFASAGNGLGLLAGGIALVGLRAAGSGGAISNLLGLLRRVAGPLGGGGAGGAGSAGSAGSAAGGLGAAKVIIPVAIAYEAVNLLGAKKFVEDALNGNFAALPQDEPKWARTLSTWFYDKANGALRGFLLSPATSAAIQKVTALYGQQAGDSFAFSLSYEKGNVGKAWNDVYGSIKNADPTLFGVKGVNAGGLFAKGIHSTIPSVRDASTSLAMAASGALPFNATQKGTASGFTFAKGLYGAQPSISTAASALSANAARNLALNGQPAGAQGGWSFANGIGSLSRLAANAAAGIRNAALGQLPADASAQGRSLIASYVAGIQSEFPNLAQAQQYANSLVSHGKNIAGFASGTLSAPKGLAWVGENGPELLRMAGGEQVIPHRQSEAMANAYSAGKNRPAGASVVQNFTYAGPLTHQVVTEAARQADWALGS